MFSKQTGILSLFFALLMSMECAAQPHPAAPTPEQTRIGEALVSVGMQIEKTALDCSHFVNSLFQQTGIYYKYQPSRALYRGASGFKRVYRPAQGDLIVWPGHVGIVVDPQAKTFLSALTHGVKVASFTSRYWRQRGQPRFFRYKLPTRDSIWLARNARPGSPLYTEGLDQSFSEVEGVR